MVLTKLRDLRSAVSATSGDLRRAGRLETCAEHVSGSQESESRRKGGMKTMNGKEQILRALRRQTPDAVPTFEWFIDAAVGRALTGSDDLWDVVECLDLDGVNIRPD